MPPVLTRALAFAAALLAEASTLAAEEAGALYAEHCVDCHGKIRLGCTGPALLPGNLGRLKRDQAKEVVANGRAATQMPAFGDTLDQQAIETLVSYVFTKPDVVPEWSKADIRASREILADTSAVSAPQYTADPLNLFVVVETGDHHATILDGDRFEVLDCFETRFALHGGSKFTPDGRYVFFISRDGWVTKYDLWALETVAEVRVGINSRNIAISRDGQYLALANYLPQTLVILSADDLSPLKLLKVENRKGEPSRVSAVYQERPRNSFIAALKDVPETWEISTDPDAPPVYEGMVHSQEKGMVEALASSSGLFALRHIEVPVPMDDFFFDPPCRNLIGSARGGGEAVVVNLTVGRDIARIDLPGPPHLGSGIAWTREGRQVMAAPHLKEGRISVIDLAGWNVVKSIDTRGPGFFMRSHEATPYAWTDVFFGPNRDLVHVIDKQTLEIVRTLNPASGTNAHVEFDRDGSHAIVSIWEHGGVILI